MAILLYLAQSLLLGEVMVETLIRVPATMVVLVAVLAPPEAVRLHRGVQVIPLLFLRHKGTMAVGLLMYREAQLLGEGVVVPAQME